MLRFTIAYFATGLFLIGFDFVWLRNVSFRGGVREMLMKNPLIIAGLMFYLVYTLALVAFAVMPAFKIGTVSSALAYGATFGFGCWCLVNLGRRRYPSVRPVTPAWTERAAMIWFPDIAWTTIISGLSAAFGFYVARAVTGL